MRLGKLMARRAWAGRPAAGSRGEHNFDKYIRELGTWPLSVSAEVSFKVATRTALCMRFLIFRFPSTL